MDLDKLNKWLVLFANLGVMVGVVFLAIEISQNQMSLEHANEISRFEARMEPVDTFNELSGLLIQDEELTRIWLDGRAGKELSEVEQARFDRLCTRLFWTHLKVHEWTIVSGDTNGNAGNLEIVRASLAQNPGTMGCWNRVKNSFRLYGADSFVDGVDNGP